MVESILYSVLHRWECWSYWDVPEKKLYILLLWQVLCNRNICTDTCENYKTENKKVEKSGRIISSVLPDTADMAPGYPFRNKAGKPANYALVGSDSKMLKCSLYFFLIKNKVLVVESSDDAFFSNTMCWCR